MNNSSYREILATPKEYNQRPKFRIRLYLSASLILLSLLPLFSAYVLVNEIIEDVALISVHQDVVMVFDEYTRDLRKLAELNPDQEEVYKNKFHQINDLLIVYKNPESIVRILKDAYFSYFFVFFIVIVGVALIMAFFLSRRVAKNYDTLIDDLLEKNNRIRQLSQFEQWQRVSSNLAHEIKNPLTPIEMMVGNLHKSYQRISADSYQNMLDNTQRIVDSELGRLKNMVYHFAQFAKLPSANLENIDLGDFTKTFVSDAKTMWPNLFFTYSVAGRRETNEQLQSVARIDSRLLTQCFVNIVNNAFDANKEQSNLHISFVLRLRKSKLCLSVENNGRVIADEDREKVFEIAYSTKNQKSSMGLGLAIVKKIMLDHDGDIHCEPRAEGACFTMIFPRVNLNE